MAERPTSLDEVIAQGRKEKRQEFVRSLELGKKAATVGKIAGIVAAVGAPLSYGAWWGVMDERPPIHAGWPIGVGMVYTFGTGVVAMDTEVGEDGGGCALGAVGYGILLAIGYGGGQIYRKFAS